MPEPVAFYPLNARYKAAEKENRQPQGILGNVEITHGPYNEPGEAYMFYGNINSFIEFPNNGGLDTRFSITLMCWVQPAGHDGPVFSYGFSGYTLCIWIHEGGKFFNRIMKHRSSERPTTITTEVLPVGKWVHVAASYDHNSGNNSLYINGHLRASQNIGTGYEIATTPERVLIGVKKDIAYFKGKIAEMKVYDVALNEAQIQTSIRQGNSKTICTFPKIVISFTSPVITLINETPVIGQLRKR